MRTDDKKNQDQYSTMPNSSKYSAQFDTEDCNNEETQPRNHDDNLEEEFDQNYSESENFATD